MRNAERYKTLCNTFITRCILFFSYAFHLDVLYFSFDSLALLYMLNLCALCNYVVLLSTNTILIIIIIIISRPTELCEDDPNKT